MEAAFVRRGHQHMQRISWTAAVIAVAFASACSSGDSSSTGEKPETPVGSESKRVEVSAELAKGLAAEGGRVIADYGAFVLVDAPAEKVAALPAEQVVDREDYKFV